MNRPSRSATEPDTPEQADTTAVGERFARLLAGKRWSAMRALLDPRVEFRGLTPRRVWEADDPEELITGVLRHWFEDTDDIEDLEQVDTGRVADRQWLRYRLRVRNGAGLNLVEQHGYYDVDYEGRIVRLQLLCAGFRPIEDGPAGRADAAQGRSSGRSGAGRPAGAPGSPSPTGSGSVCRIWVSES